MFLHLLLNMKIRKLNETSRWFQFVYFDFMLCVSANTPEISQSHIFDSFDPWNQEFMTDNLLNITRDTLRVQTSYLLLWNHHVCLKGQSIRNVFSKWHLLRNEKRLECGQLTRHVNLVVIETNGCKHKYNIIVEEMKERICPAAVAALIL